MRRVLSLLLVVCTVCSLAILSGCKKENKGKNEDNGLGEWKIETLDVTKEGSKLLTLDAQNAEAASKSIIDLLEKKLTPAAIAPVKPALETLLKLKLDDVQKVRFNFAGNGEFTLKALPQGVGDAKGKWSEADGKVTVNVNEIPAALKEKSPILNAVVGKDIVLTKGNDVMTFKKSAADLFTFGAEAGAKIPENLKPILQGFKTVFAGSELEVMLKQ